MRHLKNLNPVYVALLAVLAIALLSLAPTGPGGDAEAEYCGDGFFQRFYSDASHTTQVGTRNRACNGVTYTNGQVTQYSTVNFFPCCSF